MVFLAVLAGCGGDDGRPAPDAAELNRTNDAKEAVYLQRVLGDDPISESVSLRVDGTAAVRRGGGRGYWDVAVELSEPQAERTLRLVRGAPFAALADNTITPGGFAGDDDERRYMLRRDGVSVTVAESDLPPTMRPLVHDLNALIDGDLGRIVADDRHYSVAGVTGSDASDDDQQPPDYDSSLATPVQGGGDAPQAERTLSCYGWGGSQPGGAGAGLRAGPLTLEGLTARSRGRVLPAAAILEPGASVTVSVAPRDRDHAGLLYGGDWRGPHRLSEAAHTLRFEGCSDTSRDGGVTRFDGGIVRTGCATLLVYAGGEPQRLRVGCR
jgi:hypothetical protein